MQVVFALVAIWLAFAIIGAVFHLLKAVIWLALLASLAVLVFWAMRNRTRQ